MIELGEDFPYAGPSGCAKVSGALADVVQSPRFATACGLLLEHRRKGSAA